MGGREVTEAEKLAALSEAELLPCPFCGSPPHEVRERGPTREHYVTIECGSCGAAICIDESGLEDDEPRAADMWNTRANQLVLIGPDAVEAGIGPRTLPGKQSCKGCPALHTEDWREFLPEDDEWDSGTYGTCTAIPEGERGHSLGSYWSPASPVPDWCPATAALAALGVKP